MSNTLTTIMPKILARGLMSLRELAIMPRIVNGDYSNEAAKKGATIDVPIPSAKTATDVAPSHVPSAPTDTVSETVQVPLDNWKKVNFHLTDKDLMLIDKNAAFLPMEMSESVRALANAVNQSIHAEYKSLFGFSGTAGTTPFGTPKVGDATAARAILNAQRAPRNDRRMVLNFDAEAAALNLSEFSDLEKTGDRAVKIEGELGRKFGFDIFADDHVTTHTAGTITTGLKAKAATAQAVGDKSIVCTTAASTGACALVVGDIITFAGHTQTYVVTAAATQASAASDVTVNIYPGLVVALAGGEDVAVKASHVVNLAFHRDCFAFANRPLATEMADLALGNQITTLTDPQTGISLRLEVSRQYKQTVWELDMLWGVKCVRPELGSRIAG